MARFKLGDEVMVRSGVPAPHDFRGVVGKIVRLSDRGYFVMTGPSSAEVHFLEAELKPASRRFTKSLELRAKYKAVSDTSEFRPIPNFRWNGQTWAHNGKIGTEIKTGKPTAQYNSVEKQGSRCWRNIDGVITSDD